MDIHLNIDSNVLCAIITVILIVLMVDYRMDIVRKDRIAAEQARKEQE